MTLPNASIQKNSCSLIADSVTVLPILRYTVWFAKYYNEQIRKLKYPAS